MCAEIKVHGTTTTVILSNFGSDLERTEVLDILFQGQSAVIDGLVASHGNAPIQQLAFTFWSGQTYLKFEPSRDGKMKCAYFPEGGSSASCK